MFVFLRPIDQQKNSVFYQLAVQKKLPTPDLVDDLLENYGVLFTAIRALISNFLKIYKIRKI